MKRIDSMARSRWLISSRLRMGRDDRGVALVIVLSILVLMAGVVVAFFSQSLLQRQISKSSANLTSVEMLAHGALNTIIWDLRQEITNTANSTVSATNNNTLYIPLSGTNATPALVGATGAAGAENLVKRSAYGIPFYSNGPSRAAQTASTLASRNGRSISLARWNMPLLLAKSDTSSSTNLTPTGNFIAPDWILVNRAGENPIAWSTNLIWSGNATNTAVVVGRYAYTIYNEGGLLDANVAGYPASSGVSTGTAYSYRSSVAFADLTKIGMTQAQVNALVGWRNNASLGASGSAPNYTLDTSASGLAKYHNLILSNSNGFLSISSTSVNAYGYGATDKMFIGRQNLINFLLNNVAQSTAERAGLQTALQYLGTFSRQVDAPSFAPDASGCVTLFGQGYRTGNSASIDNQYNPSLINTRVTKTFTRDSDGTEAIKGEPLLKHRFPLSRLALVTDSATADQNSDIYKYFGLTRSSNTDPWVYNHGNASKILILSEVADADREPDFFELLQAAIKVGSLGKIANNTIQTINTLDANNYLQILQIGANIIDQYDTDSYPTRISFTSTPTTVNGVENLAYLAAVYDIPYRTLQNDSTYKRPYASVWFIPKVWYVHAGNAATGSVPTRFRFVVTGTAHCLFSGTKIVAVTATTTINGTTTITSSNSTVTTKESSSPVTFPNPTSDSNCGIHFTLNSTILSGVPTVLNSTTVASATGANVVDSTFIGISTGTAYVPDRRDNSSFTTLPQYRASIVQYDSEVTFALQYLKDSTWITYDELRNANNNSGMANFDSYASHYFSLNYYFRHRPDPRTDRFGAFATWASPSGTSTLRPNTGNGYVLLLGAQSPATGWTHSGAAQSGYAGYSNNAYFGCLTQNGTSSVTRYLDPDGVLRRASGAYATGSGSTGDYPGYPLAADNTASRPIVLNRPFKSVAELGYASRGMPWKELDFFTKESADAALLDVFCLNENTRDPAVVAGRVDLNGRQPTVIKAILSGVMKSELDTSANISDSDSGAIAQALVNRVTSTSSGKGPLLNKSELVTKFSDDISYVDVHDSCIKARREAAVRALAETGDTRTWNLLIDVIAQTGRYPASASGLNDFYVEGERRYWLHVAIDRYTGKVVDQYLEAVYE